MLGFSALTYSLIPVSASSDVYLSRVAFYHTPDSDSVAHIMALPSMDLSQKTMHHGCLLSIRLSGDCVHSLPWPMLHHSKATFGQVAEPVGLGKDQHEAYTPRADLREVSKSQP